MAGNSATFDVEFSTTNTGVATAVITVLNNDCNASSYQFTVRANLQSASAPTTPTSPVQVNLNLTAVSVSPTNINLTWTPDSRISSYRLFRNDQPITTLTGNVSSYSDENLTADTFYRYRLVGIANGTETNPALAETWTLPNAPTLVSVTTLCGGGIAKATLESNTFRYKVYATQDATTPILESNGNATFELPSISTTTTFYVSVLGRDTRQERESARTPVTVTVEPIFEAKIIGNATQLSCENTLELQAQEVENATYTWLLNGSNTGVTGRTITANSGGEYQVRIQKGSCSFTSPSVTVRLNQTPIARIAQANNSRFCDTGTLSAVATSSDLNYEWRVNTTVIGQNQSIEVSQSEVYTLIVTNSNNCQASTQIEVFVTQTPSLPVIVATENTICPTTETTLSVQNPENNVVYQWFRNGRSIRQEGSSISTSVQGNYQVRAVASQNTACDAISEELEINVVEVTPVYLRTSENNTALFVEDANGSQNEIASVEWYFEGDLKADLGSQNEITPTENGNYSAKVTNQNGCVIQTRTVYFRIAEPTIITGNEELKADKLNIYPNPNNGIFNIQFATALSENTEITIFDGIGRKVFTQTIERGNQATQINLQKIPSGVYLIRFNQNEATYTKQIIVE